jgi:hypothetical protein
LEHDCERAFGRWKDAFTKHVTLNSCTNAPFGCSTRQEVGQSGSEIYTSTTFLPRLPAFHLPHHSSSLSHKTIIEIEEEQLSELLLNPGIHLKVKLSLKTKFMIVLIIENIYKKH